MSHVKDKLTSCDYLCIPDYLCMPPVIAPFDFDHAPFVRPDYVCVCVREGERVCVCAYM